MYCINCGNEIKKEAVFCSKCGAKKEEKNATEASVTNVEKEDSVVANNSGEEGFYGQNGFVQVGNNRMPGRRMLKVVGIISAIYAFLALLVALDDLLNPYTKQLEVMNFYGLPSWYGTYLTAMNIVLGVLMLTMGMLGIVWCTKKEKAGKLAVLAIIILVLVPITLILGFIEGNTTLIEVSILLLPFNAVLPILFLIGAVIRKNSQV